MYKRIKNWQGEAIAKLFLFLFQFQYFKNKYFGFYRHVFKPLGLFDGVVFDVNRMGFELKLRIDDWIPQHIYFLGAYSQPELKILDEFLFDGAVFIDVGANIGVFTLQASRLVGANGRVVSFEPYSENFKLLNRHVRINHLSNVTTEKFAISDSNGKAMLYYDPNEKNLGMVSMTPLNNVCSEEIDAIMFDCYAQTYDLQRVDFVKIDVEGFEYNVLKGMEGVLKKFNPPLLLEILDCDLLCKEEEVENYLSVLGYVKYYISDDGTVSEIVTNPQRRNYLFVVKK